MWQKILYLGLLALLGGILTLGNPPGSDGSEPTSQSGSGDTGDSRGSIDPDGLTGGGDIDLNGHPLS
jgi:hypothetical protein